jgi:demethylmenaquinone methyltransferase/2-methoxy-6-polyprenyl-1,4-benzoquinol methylase
MRPDSEGHTTYFGYLHVPVEEKARRVGAIFNSVANRYDLLNDVMSLGIHRLWRRTTIRLSGVRRGERILDLAGGTGDLTARVARLVGAEGRVVLADVNATMLLQGRSLLTELGTDEGIRYVQADAERLPFPDECFDLVTIGFGLRNMTDVDAALASAYRVLRPRGRLVILEFCPPRLWGFRQLYDFYSFHVMPLMGRVVAGDGDSCRYLAESIRVHPDQETLKSMMEDVGFQGCEYWNLSLGIAAVHRGYRELGNGGEVR